MNNPESTRVIRVLSNKAWLDGRTVGRSRIAATLLPLHGSLPRRVLNALSLWKYDAAFVDCDASWLLLLCAAKTLLPFTRCRILSVDIILTRPTDARSRARFIVRRWLLRKVDRFVVFFRDTSGLERVYRIPRDRFRYVPFKPNTLADLRRIVPNDDGYFLACGRSNRDYSTLFEAVEGLDAKCVVLAPWNEAEQHGTVVPGVPTPPNVELASDDGTPQSWNDWIARSTAVILPIEPGMLSPSGIGTYLVAMALGKAVIITEGPATNRMLDDSCAVLVPPSDSVALRSAIQRALGDPEWRAGIARRGQEYALSLGGDDRLQLDLTNELAAMVE